jgi:two-component system sensor histidine kinase MprB
VHALRRAAEHVRLTGDLSRRIDAVGDDDLGQLGRSFNTMLAALEESQRAQQQLIADASHELRTPISTLRTNLEVLIRNPDLDPAEREPLLEDLVAEMRELGDLVDDLLESARTYDAQIGMAPVQMADLVRMEIGRLQARHPESDVSADLHPCEVHGDERRLRRAVANILENAVKWSPPGEPIEVALAEGELDVRDHGPGFFVEDLPHVFDRFYRSPVARAVPGSGLGLSIVRKVATEHGGAAEAMNAVGGGALVRLRLPCAPTARHLVPAGRL